MNLYEEPADADLAEDWWQEVQAEAIYQNLAAREGGRQPASHQELHQLLAYEAEIEPPTPF